MLRRLNCLRAEKHTLTAALVKPAGQGKQILGSRQRHPGLAAAAGLRIGESCGGNGSNYGPGQTRLDVRTIYETLQAKEERAGEGGVADNTRHRWHTLTSV
jgi:hypothetical protein